MVTGIRFLKSGMQGNLLVHVFNENQIFTRVILSFLGSLPTWSRFDSIGNHTLMDLERKLGRYRYST